MGTEIPFRLPLIDFSNVDLKPGTAEWDFIKGQVRQALEEYGCFEMSFNKVPSELREAIVGVLKELFDLPLETKKLNVYEKPFHGYVEPYVISPFYESVGIDDPNITENVERLSNLFWPQGNKNFRTIIQLFTDRVLGLDQMIRRMVLESFGLDKYMDEHMNSVKYLLRAMKYRAPQTTDKNIGLNPHTDKSMVTLLYQNEVDGLEIQTKDGEWVDVKPSPGSFVLMIGDSLYAWLNGRLQAPRHRVMMNGNKTRYSIGMFTIPKGGYMIKAPTELVDEQYPSLFKPFDYDEFMAFYATEAGQRADSALKIYCGV
ncbi:hypothetical protein REPUB_Repub14bG0038100 [Reevesia pubescens]